MSHHKDTDYLSISARIRVMENRLLTRERMDRMIDARDNGDAAKVLTECGYGEAESMTLSGLETLLSTARTEVFRDMRASVPDMKVVEVFQLKYDYHNAKTLLKAEAVGEDADRLLLSGGRYSPQNLAEKYRREDLRDFAPVFHQAILRAKEMLAASGDPQRADLMLDRACYEEMALLATETESSFLKGYVTLAVDVANLRTAVRVARMGKDSEFLTGVLLTGGSRSPQSIAAVKGTAVADLYKAGPLAQAAELGGKVAMPGGGSLTAFEGACDNALTAYLSAARRIPFGEQAVIGYIYARESEMTAIRTIMSGRLAGLSGDIIRARLRETYL